MKSRGQNKVAAQILSWRARCHIVLFTKVVLKDQRADSKAVRTDVSLDGLFLSDRL